MRYTKIALLGFGAGMLLGLIVVVADLGRLGRLASGLMAVSLAAIPIGMAVDWRLAAKAARKPARKSAKIRPRRTAAVQARRPPRPRKPAPPKR
jgi:hypothetical protein